MARRASAAWSCCGSPATLERPDQAFSSAEDSVERGRETRGAPPSPGCGRSRLYQAAESARRLPTVCHRTGASLRCTPSSLSVRMQRSPSARLPCFPMGRSAGEPRRDGSRAGTILAVNCLPRFVIRCRGDCPAARIMPARKALIATAVGRPRKTRTPMIRHPAGGRPAEMQAGSGEHGGNPRRPHRGTEHLQAADEGATRFGSFVAGVSGLISRVAAAPAAPAQHWRQSEDGGGTWQDVFVGIYTKRM
jgi:hypothetical protein